MTTLVTVIVCFSVGFVVVLLLDSWQRASRRRDREIVRRIVRYLDQAGPARPW